MVHAYSKEERPSPKDLTQTKQALLQKLSLEGKCKGRKTTFTVSHNAIETTLKAKLLLVVSNTYYISSIQKTTSLWFKMHLHVCTRYNLTL